MCRALEEAKQQWRDQEAERLANEEAARQRFKDRSRQFASSRRERAVAAEIRRLKVVEGAEKILIARETTEANARLQEEKAEAKRNQQAIEKYEDLARAFYGRAPTSSKKEKIKNSPKAYRGDTHLIRSSVHFLTCPEPRFPRPGESSVSAPGCVQKISGLSAGSCLSKLQ